MKNLKLLTSMFLSLIMVLSMAVSPVWAVTQYDGSENAPMNGTTMIANILPGFAGKDTADKVYSLTGAAADAGSGNVGFNIAKSTTSNTDTATLEFQFLLPTTTDKLRVSIHYFYNSDKSSNTTNWFNITTTGLVTTNNKISSITSKETVSLETNKWYTVSIQVPGDGSKTIPVYINGTNVATINVNSSYPVYGIRSRALVGPADSTQTVYIDDVYSYKASEKTFSPAESIPSEISAYSDGYTLSGDTLTVPYGATVADILDSIKTTDTTGDVIRVYKDSSMTSSAENSDSANGTTIVVAAKNGTEYEQAYSYYTVEEAEPDPDVLKGKSSDDIILTENADSLSVVSVEPGNYGKLSGDSVYKVTNNDLGTRVSMQHSLNGNSTFSKGKAGVIEFSFCLPEGSHGFRITSSTGHTASGNGSFVTLTVDENGVYGGSNAENHFYTGKINANTWYNFAVEIPTNGGRGVNVYLNGEQINRASIDSGAWYGFRTFFVIMKAADGEVMYLDNISVSESFTNTNQAARVNGENMATRGGKLYALNGATASDITLGANETLRLYNSDWTVAENLADADIAVFVTTNGRSMERTLTYYDVNLSDCVVDYDVTTADETETLNASVYSNTQASLILAHYTVEGGVKTFEGVTSIDATVVDGVYVAAIPASVLNPAYSYTLFAWSDTDNTITPLTTSINLN